LGLPRVIGSEKVSQSFAFDLRNNLFEKIQTLSFAYHDRTQAGQLMTRLTSDVEQVRSFVASALLQFISALMLLIGSLVALFSMNWQLTLVALVFIPPSMVVLGYFMQVVRPMFSIIQERLGLLNVVLQENISGARLVKAFGREAHEEARFAEKNDSLLEMNLKSVVAMSSSFPLIFLINNLGTLGILWAGGYKAMSGEISIGELIAFTTYLSLLFQPLFMLGMISAQITRASVSNERIFELLDTKQDVEDSSNASVMPAVQAICASTMSPCATLAQPTKYSIACHLISRLAQQWPFLALPAAARARSSTSSPGFMTRPVGQWSLTVMMSAMSPSIVCAVKSVSCSKKRLCLVVPSVPTLPMVVPMPVMPKSSLQPSEPKPMPTSKSSPKAMTRLWAKKVWGCRRPTPAHCHRPRLLLDPKILILDDSTSGRRCRNRVQNPTSTRRFNAQSHLVCYRPTYQHRA
jgi:hypothetical protein